MHQARIGLEVHVQLACTSKLLCACPLREGAPANALVCPICAGHPGTLPSLNAHAVRLAVKAGMSLNGQVQRISRFDRKHYRYADLPKGYQVTQQREPIVSEAQLHVRIDGDVRRFRIERMQIEEDSGKLLHREDRTLVDYNRAGVPLLEVVGAPDLASGVEAEAWLRQLHQVLVFAGVTQGQLELGHFRCDANISVGDDGTRVEVKNINSFRFVRKAIETEVARQRALLESGQTVDRETRDWNGKTTVRLRGKEAPADYRFLPEPDLPPLVLTPEEVHEVMQELPGPVDKHLLKLELERMQHWRTEYGLEREHVLPITADSDLEAMFLKAHEAGADPRELANWLVGPVRALAAKEDRPLADLPLKAQHLADLCSLVGQGTITRPTARKLFDWVGLRDGHIPGLVEVLGWQRIDDPDALRGHLRATMAEHPEELQRLEDGNDGLVDFFVGKVMQSTQGRADPLELRALLLEMKA
jgi:aspartyl-tRNA(Asn)/glutamyl-tRNA(Gln) amidotransferase subunit B